MILVTLAVASASSERTALAIAVAWSALVGVLLLVVPIYSSGASLIEVSGMRVLGPLGRPIIVFYIPAVFALLAAAAIGVRSAHVA